MEAGVQPTAVRLDSKNRKRAIAALAANPKAPERTMAEGMIMNLDPEAEEWKPGTKWKPRKKRGMQKALEEVGQIVNNKWKKVEKWTREEMEGWEEKIRKKVKEGQNVKWTEEIGNKQRKREEKEGEVHMYVDGAWKEGKAGAGIWRSGEEGRVLKLGKMMESLDAEMVAIREGIYHGVRSARREGRNTLIILSDSQAAIGRIGNHHHKSGEMCAQQIRSRIHEASEVGITVHLEWVKAHSKVPGNLQADQLAKAAMDSEGPPGPLAFISLRAIKRTEERLTQERAKQAWEDETPARKGKNYIGNPETVRQWKIPDNLRKKQVWLSRMRTRHVNCGNYMFNIGKRLTPECQCGAEKQDIKHILTKCPLVTQTRRAQQKKYKQGRLDLKWLLYEKEGVDAAEVIWKEAMEKRRQWERVEDEDEIEAERELKWGKGEIDQEEGE